MDELDRTLLTIIATTGKARTSDIMDGLIGTDFEDKKKFRVIERLRVLNKFGYIQIDEGEIGNHGGRKPLYYSIKG